MHLLQLLPIGLLALVTAAQTDDRPSNDVLNNKYGESPCDMKESFQKTCQNPAARDNDSTNSSRPTPTPTPCTCTNVYFNLWSACLYTENSTLPFSSLLEQNCTQASINITEKPLQPDTHYPNWAFWPLPSATSFDLAAAIESTRTSNKWTIVQIVLPIVVGVSVAALGMIGFCIYRRRKGLSRDRRWMRTTGNNPRFHFPSLSNVQKVRELDRSSSWSIEEPEEPLTEYEFVSYPASLQGSHVDGHVRLSPSSLRNHPPMLTIPQGRAQPVKAWPGRSLWKGPLETVQRLGYSMPRPWSNTKRGVVKNVGSYSRFRVDSSDSDSPLSQRTHPSFLGSRLERSRSNLHETILEQDEDNESDGDNEAEALLLIPEQHSRSSYDAPLPDHNTVLVSSSGPESSDTRRPQQSPRQIPPPSSPPTLPLPPPPPTPKSNRKSLQDSASRPSTSGSRTSRPPPLFPPAPTSPPPPPPPIRQAPRAPGNAQSPRSPPVFSPPLFSPPRIPPPTNVFPLTTIPPPPQPPPPQPTHRPRQSSDGGSVRSLPFTPTRADNGLYSQPTHRPRQSSDGGSVRSLPFTPTRADHGPHSHPPHRLHQSSDDGSLRTLPPYVSRGPSTEPIRLLDDRDPTTSPGHAVPPYIQRGSLEESAASPSETRSVRRLPLLPG